jgi:hypothetical protein
VSAVAVLLQGVRRLLAACWLGLFLSVTMPERASTILHQGNLSVDRGFWC